MTVATPSIDHNLYIRGNLVYESNYRSGLRVLDASEIAQGVLREVGFFDLYPSDDAPAYNGAWSAYPFFASGSVAVNGIEQGLFVVRPRVTPTGQPNRRLAHDCRTRQPRRRRSGAGRSS